MKTSACRDGTLKNQTNKMGMVYVVGGCNVVAIEHGRCI